MSTPHTMLIESDALIIRKLTFNHSGADLGSDAEPWPTILDSDEMVSLHDGLDDEFFVHWPQ